MISHRVLQSVLCTDSILYCVITRLEVFELKNIVDEMDESAFVTITDISDIIGNHIKSNKKIRKIKE